MVMTRELFLQAMRRVASSVTVVTTDGAAGRHGATVSAFSSVSADPPTVLVCLRKESRIARTVAANRCFSVSVLPEQRDDIARVFAGVRDSSSGDRFEGVVLTSCGSGLAPGIAGATVLACRLVEVVDHRSHSICIGEVMALSAGEHPPLTYHDGRYRRLQRDPLEDRMSGIRG